MRYLAAITSLLLAFSIAATLHAQQADEAKPPPPKTLEEAHQQLDKHLIKSQLAKIDAMQSQHDISVYDRVIGSQMHREWGTWDGDALRQHMEGLGFRHIDDMIEVILRTYWCRRHQKDYRLKELAQYYHTLHNGPPKTAIDPQDGAEVRWNKSTIYWGNGRSLHVGQSAKTNRWLVYEYDRGVYEPDTATMNAIDRLVQAQATKAEQKPVEE